MGDPGEGESSQLRIFGLMRPLLNIDRACECADTEM